MLDFSRTKITFGRSLTDYSKVRGLMGHVIRNNRLFCPRIEAGAYLQLGAGANILPGFINADFLWSPGLDLCCDFTRPLPIASAVIGGIFSEHCLEHMSLEHARFALAECHRVMMPGALLRVVVPDLEIYARTYVDSLDGQAVTFPHPAFVNRTGVSRPVALINELFYGPDHRFIYDFQALAQILADAGFSEVTRRSYRQGSDSRLLVDNSGHVSESLYVEALKA
jgi:predicted SAM-dependent methyltransferase